MEHFRKLRENNLTNFAINFNIREFILNTKTFYFHRTFATTVKKRKSNDVPNKNGLFLSAKIKRVDLSNCYSFKFFEFELVRGFTR